MKTGYAPTRLKRGPGPADTSYEGYRPMDMERPPSLRTTGPQGGETGAATPSPGGTHPINALAELVADLIAATGLLPPDRLAVVKGAAGQGSLAAALLESGYASSEGIAKTLAARHQMPLVELGLTGVNPEAANLVPLHVLERVVAIPYALEGDTLRIAVADPSNLHGMDELRLATKHSVELA